MIDQVKLLEQYLKAKFSEKNGLSIFRLEKLRDGWESDNYLLTVDYGSARITREEMVWRIYSGEGSQAKAVREFTSLKQLMAAGYPVPQVYLLETEGSLMGRPFIIMEYVQGEMMWELIDLAPADRREHLIDQFCQLFTQLHGLDWKQFAVNLMVEDPYTFIDRWLKEAREVLPHFPEVEAVPFLEWVATRRGWFACESPSPIHHDFHPGNVLIKKDGSAVVIDWTGFQVTDYRFDLAWTLVLAMAYRGSELRNQILQGYQQHVGRPVEQIEAFEAIACARRLFDLTVSLTKGADRMGMNPQAAKAMRADMEPHRRVYDLFTHRTGLHIEAFDNLFG